MNPTYVATADKLTERILALIPTVVPDRNLKRVAER